MNKILVLINVMFLLIINVASVKILVVLPAPSKSHFIFAQKLLNELTDSGHELTVISPFPLKSPRPNYRDISTIDILENTKKGFKFHEDEFGNSLYARINGISGAFQYISRLTLTHPNVKQLIESNEKFDLILVEVFLMESLYGFGHLYNAPMIGLSTSSANSMISNFLGSPNILSYSAHTFSGLTDKMSFCERFQNAFVYLTTAFHTVKRLKFQKHLYEQVFPNPKPTFESIVKHGITMGFINGHHIITGPQPLFPNTIEVAGMHIEKNFQPLPDDVRLFIESAEHGVIYFSMGSNLVLSGFRRDKVNAMFAALSKLKEKVLWKFDDPELFPKHENILIRKWFDQNEILAHPKIKAFITHGGLLSYIETMYYGVPIIGIPIYGDQLYNVARMKRNGVGVHLSFKNITETSLLWAIHEIGNNEKYKQNAMLSSKKFRDQPLTPLENAKYWTEYVIRHKGGPHLHLPSQDLSFVEYHMIDVWACYFGIFMSLFLILFLSIKLIYKKLYGNLKIDTIKKKR